MPLIGHDRLAGDICSYFEWSYDNAQAAAARSRHRFVRPFRAGMSAWPALGWLDNAPDEAFALSGIRWRLSFELPYLPPNQPPACRFAGSGGP